MIKNELKTPTLRFSDFTSDWEETKLKNITDRIIEKNKDFKVKDVFTNSAKYGVVIQKDFFDKDIAQKNNINNYYIAEKGCFIYNPRISKYALAGPLKRNNIGTGCVSPLYEIFMVKNSYKDFLEYYFNTKRWHRYMFSVSNFGARYDRMNITKLDFYNMPIFLPQPKEQNKITVFLSSVDKRIDLLQQKHDTFIQYKNALMQGLFPQKGQTNPSMRLNDKNNNPFTKNWQNKKLGDVAKFSKGQGLSKNDIIENGKNDCILYGELYTKYYENINTVYSKTNIESNSCSKVGDLLFPASTTTNATDLATASVVNKDNILLSGDINIVRLNLEEYSPLCLSYMIRSSLKKNIARLGQGITIVHLYNSHLKTICFKSPELEEQNKIAGFLSAVDKKIENISNQLNQSKQFKKSLMQKMFI